MSKKKNKKDDRNPEIGRKSTKVWFLWVALAISFALNVALIYWFYDRNYNETDTYTLLSDCTVRLEDALAREEQYNIDKTRMEKMIDDLQMRVDAPKVELSEATVKAIQNMGLDNPEFALSYDLIQHSELIPFESSGDAKLRFPSQNGITVLSPHFVFARFSDGIRNGSMVLEFTVGKDKKINWKVLKAYRD